MGGGDVRLKLNDVMDDLGSALGSIPGLRVFPYWADKVVPPAAVVGWPDPLTYDQTMRRGSDRVTDLPVFVMVGKVDARTSRDQLAVYADGAGARSVKTVIEAHPATAWDVATVTRAEFGTVTVGGVEYLSATFYIDISGSGS